MGIRPHAYPNPIGLRDYPVPRSLCKEEDGSKEIEEQTYGIREARMGAEIEGKGGSRSCRGNCASCRTTSS